MKVDTGRVLQTRANAVQFLLRHLQDFGKNIYISIVRYREICSFLWLISFGENLSV